MLPERTPKVNDKRHATTQRRGVPHRIVPYRYQNEHRRTKISIFAFSLFSEFIGSRIVVMHTQFKHVSWKRPFLMLPSESPRCLACYNQQTRSSRSTSVQLKRRYWHVSCLLSHSPYFFTRTGVNLKFASTSSHPPRWWRHISENPGDYLKSASTPPPPIHRSWDFGKFRTALPVYTWVCWK